MLNFNNVFNTPSLKRFFSPTRIIMGRDSRNIIFDIISDKNKIVLVLDRFFNRDGFIKQIYHKYPNSIIAKLIVKSEPDSFFIDSNIKVSLKKIDYIIAIGGGSTIDTAKAIIAKKIYGDYHHIGYGEYRFVKPKNKSGQPYFVALPTTAGTGTETSRYYLISDKETKEKVVSRSWSVVPDLAILDSYFLEKSPPKILILGAFDAFLHLWETFICRYERSIFNDMLVLEGISKILSTMEILDKKGKLSSSQLLDLQYAATLGGIALSNVRTGVIHDAGEALSAQASLSHPESLIVFFEQAIGQYLPAIGDREEILINRVKTTIPELKIYSIKDVVNYWKAVFEKHDIYKHIKDAIGKKHLDSERIINKILQDQVLINKESPVLLTSEMIRDFIVKSLNRYIKNNTL